LLFSFISAEIIIAHRHFKLKAANGLRFDEDGSFIQERLGVLAAYRGGGNPE
jgi:hypothetical protein